MIDLKFFNETLRNAISCGIAISVGQFLVHRNFDDFSVGCGLVLIILVLALLLGNLVQVIFAVANHFSVKSNKSKFYKVIQFTLCIIFIMAIFTSSIAIFTASWTTSFYSLKNNVPAINPSEKN